MYENFVENIRNSNINEAIYTECLELGKIHNNDPDKVLEGLIKHLSQLADDWQVYPPGHDDNVNGQATEYDFVMDDSITNWCVTIYNTVEKVCWVVTSQNEFCV
jgi:hypothetical protein